MTLYKCCGCNYESDCLWFIKRHEGKCDKVKAEKQKLLAKKMAEKLAHKLSCSGIGSSSGMILSPSSGGSNRSSSNSGIGSSSGLISSPSSGGSNRSSSSSGIGSSSGLISSPSSGGSNWSSSMSNSSLNRRARAPRLNRRARDYTPQRGLRSGFSNLSGTQIHRVSGGSSGGLLPVIPNPHMQSPLPSSPSNNFYRPLLESSPSPSPIPSTIAPPQPPSLGRATPESTPHRPTTSSAKSKSPVARNLPSESFKTKPFPDESITDVSKDLPSASISIQSPLCSYGVPLDGIDCTLPPGLTRNETRTGVLLSAGSTQNRTLSTLTSGSTQNDCSMTSGSTDQSRTFSRDELDGYMNRVLHEVGPRRWSI